MSTFLQSADTPFVTRSRFVDGLVLIRGEQFEDGRDRLVVSEATSDDELREVEEHLAEHHERMAQMDALIALVKPSGAGE